MTIYWRAPFFPTSSDVHQCPKCGTYVVAVDGKYDNHLFGREDMHPCEASGQPIEEKPREET